MPITDHFLAGADSATSPADDNLIAGNTHLLVSRKGTLVSGQNLKRGALLGRITTGGKLTLSLSASSDGSQNPVAVLAHDTDASAADTETLVYDRGDFNEAAVTFGTAHTADSVRTALRALGITLIKPYGVA